MNLFQAKIALIGLRLEAKTGMKMTGKVNTYRLVANALGYDKKARPKIEALVSELEESIFFTEMYAGKKEVL